MGGDGMRSMPGGNPGYPHQQTTKAAGATYQQGEREDEGDSLEEGDHTPLIQHRLRATVSREMEGEPEFSEYTEVHYPTLNNPEHSMWKGKGRA